MTSNPYDAPRAQGPREPAPRRSRWQRYGVPMTGGMAGGVLCIIGVGVTRGDPFPPFLLHALFLAAMAVCALPATLLLRLSAGLHWAWRLLLSAVGTAGLVLGVLAAIGILMA